MSAYQAEAAGSDWVQTGPHDLLNLATGTVITAEWSSNNERWIIRLFAHQGLGETDIYSSIDPEEKHIIANLAYYLRAAPIREACTALTRANELDTWLP